LEVLPIGVAEPGQYPDANTDPQGRAASELATIAVAWALLHELRHIRHQQDGTGADPYSDDKAAKHAEEMSCDAFATTFLLEQIDLYAQSTNQSADLIRRKRQLGIYFGLFAVTMLAKDKCGESKSHPAVQARIDAVRKLMADQKSDIAAAMVRILRLPCWGLFGLARPIPTSSLLKNPFAEGFVFYEGSVRAA